jgi:hypothetical protein
MFSILPSLLYFNCNCQCNAHFQIWNLFWIQCLDDRQKVKQKFLEMGIIAVKAKTTNCRSVLLFYNITAAAGFIFYIDSSQW